MQFGLTETQQVLKNSAREFLAGECPMGEVRRILETDTAHDRNLWRKIAEQGWTGIVFPEEHRGLGLGMVELAAAMEEMGRALMPGPYLSTVVLAGSLIDEAAGSSNKRRYLAPICAGETIATVALLEKTARWDSSGVRLDGSGPLRGTKLFVPDAAVADIFLVAALAGDELVLLAVDASAEGITVTPQPAMDLTRRLYEVNFHDVTPMDVLARGPKAEAALARALDVAAAGLAAEMVGGIERVLEITVDYAKTRKQFGKPIGQYQAVQHHCADMFLLLESSRSAAYYAAWALDQPRAGTAGGVDAPLAVSIAKMYASDAYREVGNKGIQVHGGMGFTWENDIHLYYKRAKASEIAFGDANYHRERIARLVIDGCEGGAE